MRLIIEWGRGRGIHISNAKVKAAVGVTKNKKGDDADGRTGSLINNFRPSAIGWRRPYAPTTLGPLRNCI